MKKKIAVIGLKGLPAFGGSARAGESVIQRLKNKYDFTIYAIDSHTKIHGAYNGINQIVFKSFKNHKLNIIFYYLKSAIHCLFKGEYDIIHLNHGNSGFIIPLLKFKYKIITTLRGNGENTLKYDKLDYLGKKLFLICEWLILKYSNIVTTVSHPHINYYKNRIDRKIYYIPNGINIFKASKQIEIPYNDYIFFSAARIVQIKGLHILLKSLHKINYTGMILVVGDLNQNHNYKKEVKEIARNLNIKFVGLIKDKDTLMSYLKNAKLFIFPSIIEAMSNMLLETASVKTPIICSDIRENKAVFDENEVLLFKSENSEDLSKKILFALKNPDVMIQKANNAHQKLLQHYLWENISKQYEKIYDELLGI